MKKYYQFVRKYSGLNKIVIMSIFGLFTTAAFAGETASTLGLIDSVVALFSSPAAYLLFTAGGSVGYGVSQRTNVKALKERLDEYKAAVDQFNKIRNDALEDKLKHD